MPVYFSVPKINWLPQQRPLDVGWLQNQCQICHPHQQVYQIWKYGKDQTSTFWDIWWKKLIFGYRPQSCNFYPCNLRDYWTQCYQIYIQKSLPFNILKSELSSRNSFRRLVRQMSWVGNYTPKMVAMATSLDWPEKGRINNLYTTKCIPFGENRSSRSEIKGWEVDD